MTKHVMRRTTVLAVAVSMFTWAMAGVALAQEAATGSISASDQSGDGSTVVVDEVTIEGGPGFVVVHLDEDGGPGPVLGHVDIPEGTSSNVTVTLDTGLDSSATVWPMLHLDAGEVGVYEFPGADGPVLVDGEVVMLPIEYQVEELPFTGGPNPWWAVLALGMIAGGLAITRRPQTSQ